MFVVPFAGWLLRSDPSMRQKVFRHSASFFVAFNNLQKPEFCSYVFEGSKRGEKEFFHIFFKELALLKSRVRSSTFERLVQLNKISGTGTRKDKIRIPL